MESNKQSKVPLRAIMREWGRIGIIGFGGPPAHIALLRERCVEKFGWISAEEFESAIAAVNLLPGPASTTTTATTTPSPTALAATCANLAAPLALSLSLLGLGGVMLGRRRRGVRA